MKTREKATIPNFIFTRVHFFQKPKKNPKESSVLRLSLLASRLEKSTKTSPKNRLMIWIRQEKKTSQQVPAKIPKPTSFNGNSPAESGSPEKSQVNPVENKTQKSGSSGKTRSNDVQEHLKNYLLAVKKTGCSSSTIRNYKSDINQFLDFLESSDINDLRNKPKLLAFARYQRDKGLKESSIKRKLVSITQFKLWLKEEGLLGSEIPLSILGQAKDKTETLERKIIDKGSDNKHEEPKKEQTPDKKDQKKDKKPKNRLFIFLNILALFLFLGGLAYFAYQQFGQAIISMAYPSTPTAPSRILSYQGRLTDTAQNPITTATNMVYKLYDADTAGNELWNSNTCSIDPDQDGIFNASLGAGSGTGSDNENCGAEIDESVFTENTNVWLEVTVGAETLTPRQPIRTVAYAVNSSTLQGLRPSEIATNSTILMMNSNGEVVLGTDNPTIKSATDSSGMTIEAQQITIQTTSGSNGDIVLAPDGTGNVDIQGNLSVSGTSTLTGNTYITSPNTLIFNGTTALGEITSPTDSGAYLIGAYDEFDNSANTNLQAILNDFDTVITDNKTPIWSNLTAPTANLSIEHSTYTTAFNWATGTGTDNLFSLTADDAADGTGSILNIQSGTSSSTLSPLRVAAGSTEAIYVDSNGNVGIGDTTPDHKFDVTGNIGLDTNGYINWGDTDGTSGYGIRDNSGTLQYKNSAGDWADIGSGGGSSYWASTDGALYPGNSTLDLLIGGTSTAAAKFAFTNMDSGTPTFSMANQASIFDLIDSTVDALNIENNLMSFDTSNSRVGIGTNAPNALLGLAAATTSQAQINLTSSAGVDPTTPVNGDLWWDGTSLNFYDGASTNDLLAGGSLWTDAGTYIYPTNGETLGDSTSGGTNKIAGLYLADSAPLYFGTDNDLNFTFAGSTLSTTLGSNVWDIASNLLYIDGANSKIGIGTNNPLATLDIRALDTDVPVASISGATNLATLILDQSGSGDIFTASSSGNTQFVITNEGYVGIGVADPSSRLQIAGATSVISNDTGDITINPASGFVSFSGATINNILDGIFSGSVGIGATTPDRKLEIIDASNPQMRLTHTDGSIYADFQMDSNGDLVMNVDGVSNQLVLDNGGNVGIGLTNPDEKLTVNGSVNAEKYYDYTNKNYFLDPAAISTSLKTAGDSHIGGDIYVEGGEIFFTPLTSSTSTTEGTVYYDSDVDHLYLYDGNSTWRRVALDMTKYSDTNTIANGEYVEIAHNQNSNDLSALGWVYDSISSLWKNVSEYSNTYTQNLQNQWDDVTDDSFYVHTESKLTDVELLPSVDVGTGTDGDITVSTNTNINTTNSISGRSCADGGDAVSYNVTALTSTTATLNSTPSTGCLNIGDEVLLINLQGATTAMDNVGNYETLRVSSISTNVITFTTAKTKYYGDGTADDANLGTTTGTQRVILQRVPNYNDVTVNNSISFYPSAWDGTKGGVMFFRANGTVTINGTITTSSMGYRKGDGAIANSNAYGGDGAEGICGYGGDGGIRYADGADNYCGGGGGAGSDDRQNPIVYNTGGDGSDNHGGGGGAGGGAISSYLAYAGAGGGGGNGTAATAGQGGVNGTNGGTNTSGDGGANTATYYNNARGGGAGGGGSYGDSTLSDRLTFGSGGGGGGGAAQNSGSGYTAAGGNGGDGGGIIYISSEAITVNGSVISDGDDGITGGNQGNFYGGSGGGGAGGSVALMADSLNIGSNKVSADGGDGHTYAYNGGNGGDGIIAIYYTESYSGSTSLPTPTYTQQPYYPYGLYHSPAIATPNATSFNKLSWELADVTNTKISFQTRTGNSPSPIPGVGWKKYNNETPPESDTTSTDGRVPLGTNGTGDDHYASQPSVIKDGGTYKMWYSGYDGSAWRIYYATSPDGLTWTKYDNSIPTDSNSSSSGGRVPLGVSGSGDDASVRAPTVIKDGSTYKMWYAGHDGSYYRIYYAFSSDGIYWTKWDNSVPANSDTASTNGRIPIGTSGTGDQTHTAFPTVIKDGSTYKMWYAGFGSDGATTSWRIYYATSPDGLTWTKYDNSGETASNITGTNGRIPLGTDESGENYHVLLPNVILDNGIYKMWYVGQQDGLVNRIYHATSTDGLTWTKYDNSPPEASNTIGTNGRLPLGENSENHYGDQQHTYGGSVLIDDDGSYKFWYSGVFYNHRMFLATSEPWEEWKPAVADTNYKSLQTANTHTDWTGTNMTVADGDVTRNVNQFEDESESSSANITKLSTSTDGGYAEATITATRLADYDYLTFWVRSSQTGNTVTVSMGESTGDELSETIAIDEAGTWQKVYWDLTDIPMGNKDAITKLRVTNNIATSTTIYIDNFKAEKLLTDPEGSTITSTPNDYIQYRAVMTTTNSGYQPQLENVSFTYNNGYKIEQVDSNTVRLYNYTGDDQQVRLDVVVFGADLAEWYTVKDDTIEAADLVSITGEMDEYGVPILEKSSKPNDRMLAGVISTQAGTALGIEADNRRLLALDGRVPIKIDPNSDPIAKGDHLTSSGKPGLARKAKAGEISIARSFEAWNPGTSKDRVLAIVNDPMATPSFGQQLVDGVVEIADLLNLKIQDGWEVVNSATGEGVQSAAALAQAVIGKLKAGQIEVSEITAPEGETLNLDASNISIQLEDQEASGSTTLGKLIIQNKDGETLASFDSEGNASISGQLDVEGLSKLGKLMTQEASISSLTAENATISGELAAGNIEADSARLDYIESKLANLENASVSGTLYAENIQANSIQANVISGLEERLSSKIAETLDQPSLLATLFGEQQQQTDEYLKQLQEEINSIASSSASLNEIDNLNSNLDLIADNAFINEYFEVNGNAYVNNSLKLGNSLMIGDDTIIGNGFINYQPQLAEGEDFTFSIQPTGVGKLSLLAGLMTLDNNGLVTINGDLKVAGTLDVGDNLKVNNTLLTNMISANNPGENIQVQLASIDPSSAIDDLNGEDLLVQKSNFEFVDENSTPVASFSSAGDLSLSGSIRLNQVEIASDSGELINNRSAGQAMLSAGSTEITIQSDKIEENSMIYVTPMNSTNNQVLYVKDKLTDSPFTPEKEGQFTVAIDYALGHNVTFNWWIIQLN